MAQFDVYRNKDAATRARIPYLLDVQGDFLSELETRVVVPLVVPERFGKPIKRFHPAFRLANRTFILSTGEIAGIHRSELGPVIVSLASARDDIIVALDVLITGV